MMAPPVLAVNDIPRPYGLLRTIILLYAPIEAIILEMYLLELGIRLLNKIAVGIVAVGHVPISGSAMRVLRESVS